MASATGIRSAVAATTIVQSNDATKPRVCHALARQ
jgi:hypothetical protein